MVIPYIYDDAFSFNESLALVMKDRKYGFIDKHGKKVVPLIYDNAHSFQEGKAWVEKNNKFGFINKAGKIIIPTK